MNRVFARPYASALFEIAKQSDQLEAVAGALCTANEIATHDLMSTLIKQPGVPADFLAKLFIEIGSHAFDEGFGSFIKLLCSKGRAHVIPQIYEIYIEMMNDHLQKRQVKITTAYQLSNSDLQTLEQKLAKRFGKDVEISVQTDEALLGGVIIESDDEVIDGSVRGRFNRLNESLLSII